MGGQTKFPIPPHAKESFLVGILSFVGIPSPSSISPLPATLTRTPFQGIVFHMAKGMDAGSCIVEYWWGLVRWATEDGLQCLPVPRKKIQQEKNGAIQRMIWNNRRRKKKTTRGITLGLSLALLKVQLVFGKREGYNKGNAVWAAPLFFGCFAL